MNQKNYEAILEKIKTGGVEKEKAIRQLLDLYDSDFAQFGSYKYQALSEPELKSAYHDAILSLLKNIEEQKFKEESSLKTYLTSIFLKKCIDEVRKKFSALNKLFVDTTNSIDEESNDDNINNELLKIEDNSARNIIESLIKKDEYSLLHKRLTTLGEVCRRILWLWARDFKNNEILEIMDSYNSEKAVATKISECLKKLKSMYNK